MPLLMPLSVASLELGNLKTKMQDLNIDDSDTRPHPGLTFNVLLTMAAAQAKKTKLIK